jgi:hypothetical protein
MEQAGMISTSMISTSMIGTSKLSLFIASIILGTSALMYAQEQREDSKPNETSRPAASKDEKTRPVQDDKRGTVTPQDSRDRGAKAPEQNEDRAVRGEDRSSHQQDNNSRMEQRTDRNTQSNRETNNETSTRDSRSDRGTMQAQGNDHRSGGRIPQEQFQSHFGRQHTFAVSHPTVVGGQPQFQYGGYTFNIIGAWPADWSYSDEYYVDSINDDYILFDLAHPGVSVAIVVVM